MNHNNENYLVLNEITNYLKYEYLNSGFNGTCYKTKNGKVYKEFKNYLNSLDFLRSFTEVKNDSIVFPNEIVYYRKKDNNNIKGYLMDYVDGTLLSQIDFGKVRIIDFINASNKVEKDLEKLAYKNSIIIDEVNPNNIIYTKENELKLIDTDFYSYMFSEHPRIIYRFNMIEWANNIIPIFEYTNPLISEHLTDQLEKCIFIGSVTLSELLYEYYNYMQNKAFYQIETLDDFNENLKLLKKL